MQNYEIRKLEEYDQDYIGIRELISINTNHKGSLTRLSVNQNINLIIMVDFKVGNAPRANHYHKIKDEYFFLIEGAVYGYFKNDLKDDIKRIRIEKNTMVHIKPGCVHAFEAIENGYAIEFTSNTAEEIANDTFAEHIIDQYKS